MDIFPDDNEFISALHELNKEHENDCVEAFQLLARRLIEEDELPPKTSLASSILTKHKDILGIILDRVAFFPVKPDIMKEKLISQGLSPSLSSGLSTVWSSVAKPVVLARRKLDTTMQRIHYQVLRNISSLTTLEDCQESVLIHLEIDEEKILHLRFTPSQLFKFYLMLEDIQAKIDQICQ